MTAASGLLPQIVVEDRADAGDFQSGGGDGDYLATVPRHDPSAVWEGGGEQLGLILSEHIYQHRIIARSTQRRVAEVATRRVIDTALCCPPGRPSNGVCKSRGRGTGGDRVGREGMKGYHFDYLVLSCNFKCVRSRSVSIIHGFQF